MSKPLKIFVTYSHANTAAKDKLITYLDVMKRQDLISIWHDNEILGGDKWREEIFSTNLPNSDVLLYLVSADSLASENCNRELSIALDEKIRIIPIILEDCDWKNDKLGDFQASPERGKAINEWQPESKGWQSVVDGIRKVVKEIQSQPKSSPRITPKEVETLAFLAFHRGNFMMMLKQTDEALKDYSRAIELSPNNAAAYINRGVAYGEKGEHKLAIRDYTTAIKLNPDFANAYNNRGYTYVEKGEADLAIKDLNKAIEIDCNFAEAYNNRGYAYCERDEINSAINDFTKALELNQDFAEAYNNRGAAYNKKSEYDLAIEDFNKAIRLKEDYVEAYSNRGGAYCGKGEYSRAIRDCDFAIKLDRDYAGAYNSRGTIYVERGEFNRAIDDFDIAIRLKSDHAGAYYNRGTVYANKGDFDSAIGDFTKTIELKPNFVEAYYNRGLVYYQMGEVNHSIEDYTKAIELDLDLAKGYKNRGIAFLHIGEADLAVADLSKVIQLWPKNSVTYYLRATQVWFPRKEWKKAKADLTTAKSLGLNISALFSRDFGAVNDFEQMIGIRLPTGIAVMLTPRQI